MGVGALFLAFVLERVLLITLTLRGVNSCGGMGAVKVSKTKDS